MAVLRFSVSALDATLILKVRHRACDKLFDTR